MRKDPKRSVHTDALVQIMEQRQGLDISAYEGSFLWQTIACRLAETGLQTVEEYGKWLAGNRAEAEVVYRSLHVGYSEFFRDPLAFALLEQQLLPAVIAGKKQTGGGELRVRSAGCAAGQEAWSMAILLDARTASPADSLYGDFDLILCCNLLFYYRPDVRRRILDKLCRALSPGGYFVTGEVERALVAEHAGLRVVTPPAAVFQTNR